jgi:putative endonuclease
MFVYILASKTRRLYVGVTNNLVRRVWEHRMEMIPGFTRRYGIKQLVYYEQIDVQQTAILREKQIKDYARVKKFALIATLNPEWHDLAEDWFTDVNPADFSRVYPERSEGLEMTREGARNDARRGSK